MRARRLAPWLALPLLVLPLACGSDDESPTAAPETSAPSVDAAREALDLAVGWMNGAPVDEAAFERSFSEEFRSSLPFAGFTQGLEELRARGPWTVAGSPESDGTGSASATLDDAAGESVTLAVTTRGPNDPTMEGLFVRPVVDPPTSIDAAVAALQPLGTLRLLTARLGDDECVPITAIDAESPMPLGSVFKLYVLGGLVDAVERGDVSWDQGVSIRDELDSIPAGTTQDEAPGTEVTVRELATRMISISDNTATDHLIDLLGREAVEEAQAAYGHAQPELNAPFLTTRELTIIKFSGGDLAARYGAASTDARRGLLEEEVAEAPLPPLTQVASAQPTAVSTVEWFASPADICRALVALDSSAEARTILAENPGVPSSDPEVQRIAFKGGSEPGVLALSWLVERRDGERFVVAGGLANETAPIDEPTAVTMLAGVRDLVAAG